MFDLNPTYVTLITAIFGGAGVEILKKVLARPIKDDAAAIRDELRQHIDSLQAEIESLKKEAEQWKREGDEWREKYWAQVKENVDVRGEMEKLRIELTTLKDKLESPPHPE